HVPTGKHVCASCAIALAPARTIQMSNPVLRILVILTPAVHANSCLISGGNLRRGELSLTRKGGKLGSSFAVRRYFCLSTRSPLTQYRGIPRRNLFARFHSRSMPWNSPSCQCRSSYTRLGLLNHHS